ncbi:hypothetical protein NDU88_002154 [Pleurodeles waltl]|uniref:Uncharacterized protein n=1 Tax=Pleurodeles waltl TaxID=8319 RepID=A0AAV7WNM4_PLEWA|nr:hypothetical protein NDU88_002154 [Pleurodeles waltl]
MRRRPEGAVLRGLLLDSRPPPRLEFYSRGPPGARTGGEEQGGGPGIKYTSGPSVNGKQERGSGGTPLRDASNATQRSNRQTRHHSP